MKLIKSKKFFLPLISLLLLITAVSIYIFTSPIADSSKELVLNIPKSTYSVGESILFNIAALDTSGKILCNSKLKLEIVSHISLFKSEKTIITPLVTSTCTQLDTSEPDYIARFTPQKTGKYEIFLTNLDTKKKIKINLEIINKKTDFVVERWGATRINSKIDRYPMIIKITANKDFSGEIIETVPADFKIIWQGNAKVSSQKTSQSLTWNVNLKKGESINLAYDYSTSSKSPNLIKIYPVKINNSPIGAPWVYLYAK